MCPERWQLDKCCTLVCFEYYVNGSSNQWSRFDWRTQSKSQLNSPIHTDQPAAGPIHLGQTRPQRQTLIFVAATTAADEMPNSLFEGLLQRTSPAPADLAELLERPILQVSIGWLVNTEQNNAQCCLIRQPFYFFWLTTRSWTDCHHSHNQLLAWRFVHHYRPWSSQQGSSTCCSMWGFLLAGIKQATHLEFVLHSKAIAIFILNFCH